MRNSNGLLLGALAPRVRSVPEFDTSAGEDAIDLAASAGLLLDDWQQDAVIDILGEGDDGLWASFEAALIIARQNGKGSILEAVELAGLFLFGERLIIHTAHEFKTAAEAYLRIKFLIENTPSLHKKVRAYHGSHGDEGISLKNGQRLRFLARSKGSGRGFSCDRLIYDEAYELPASSVAASLPTLSARPNPQVIYASSAPLDNSETLKSIVNRGRHKAGTDWSSLAYIEYSANPKGYDKNAAGKLTGLDLDDRRGWSDANPGLGIRLRETFILKERAAMTDVDFGRERLGVIDDDLASGIIDQDKWELRRDPESTVLDPVSFAIDTNPDATWTSITVAGMRADGKIHTEVVARARNMGWVVDRMVELKEDWEPENVIIDAASPAMSLLHALTEAGIEVYTTNTKEFGGACVNYFNMIEEDRLRHTGQTQLTAATVIASKRDLGEAGLWGWARRDAGDISPLVSSTLAVFGHTLGKAEHEEEQDNSVVILRR